MKTAVDCLKTLAQYTVSLVAASFSPKAAWLIPSALRPKPATRPRGVAASVFRGIASL